MLPAIVGMPAMLAAALGAVVIGASL